MNTGLAAARRERRTAHEWQLRRAGFHEVITVNDDFTDELTDVRYLARTRRPLIMDVQESKRTDYRKILDDGPDGWGVRQRLADDSTAGVATIWDRQLVTAIGDTRDQASRLGFGYAPLVVPHNGEDMLTRGIVWQDLKLAATGFRFRSASTHRPPLRHRHLWPVFDDHLEAWLEDSPLPTLVGTDNNQPGGPNVPDDWRWKGIGIDGFFGDIVVSSVYELDRRNSDHRPVSGAARLKPVRVRVR